MARRRELMAGDDAARTENADALATIASGAQHVVIVTGLSGAGQDDGQQALRGPRLHRRRQRAARPVARPRRAGGQRPGALSPGGPGAGRAHRQCAAGARRGHGRAPGPRPGAPGVLPGSQRRDAHPPLQRDASPPSTGQRCGAIGAIQAERDMLQDIRSEADEIIDTSNLSGRQLRERIQSSLRIGREPDSVFVNVISFGYKYGVPLESDLVFDVRFMENPFYVPELRPHNGLPSGCPGVRPRPAGDAPFPGVRDGLLQVRHPGLPVGGQDTTDDRDRLHRRLPSLGRHRRGTGRPTCARTTRGR